MAKQSTNIDDRLAAQERANQARAAFEAANKPKKAASSAPSHGAGTDAFIQAGIVASSGAAQAPHFV